MSVTVYLNKALRKNLSCSNLEISKNFVNKNEILHYDIFFAKAWIVNRYFLEIMIETKNILHNSLLTRVFKH